MKIALFITLIASAVMSQSFNCTSGNDGYCLACSTTAGCSTCANAYLSTGNCISVPTNTVPNCLFYNSTTTCFSCAQGYYLNDNKCKDLVDNCVAGDASGVCTTCNNTFAPVSEKCTGTTACSVTNCQWCSSAGCLKCANNYVLQGGACIATPSSVTGCRAVSTTSSNVCILCENGYSINGASGICQASTKTVWTKAAGIWAAAVALLMMLA